MNWWYGAAIIGAVVGVLAGLFGLIVLSFWVAEIIIQCFGWEFDKDYEREDRKMWLSLAVSIVSFLVISFFFVSAVGPPEDKEEKADHDCACCPVEH